MAYTIDNSSPGLQVVNEPTGGSSGGGMGGDWISAAINLGSTIYNAQANKKAQERANKANRELAEYQYSTELDMWNRMNDYNSPASQRARYEAAGLNPNMIYGSGGSGGNAQTMPHYNAPTMQPAVASLNGIGDALSSYQNFQMRQAQIDNVRAQTENVNSRTANEALRGPLLSLQGRAGEADLTQKLSLYPYQASAAKWESQSSEAKYYQDYKKLALMSQEEQMNALRQTGMQTQNDIAMSNLVFNQYRNEWTKMGITSSDNVYVRMLSRALGSAGLISPGEGLSRFRNEERSRLRGMK